MLFLAAINSLLERPGRSILTMLGIIIGVASIYALLTIGNATKNTILASLDGAEGRAITITPKLVQGRQSQGGFIRPFSDKDVENLSNLSGVEFVSGQVRAQHSVVSPTMDLNTSIIGGDEHFVSAQDITIAVGSNISRLDLDNAHSVVVLGSSICLLYTSPSPRDQRGSRMPSSA